MRIADICRQRVISVDRGSSLVHAAALMRTHHVGALVVTTQTPEGSQVSGIVTDRDLVVEVLARGLDGTRIRIGDLACSRVETVSGGDELGGAIAAMQRGGVRRLLVLDGDRRVTGIVSLDDMLGACAAELCALANVVRSGIEREAVGIEEESAPVPVPIPTLPRFGSANADALSHLAR